MTLIAPELGDELGPEKITIICEPRVGLEAVVVVDNVACGPAIGGVRMASDVTIEEVVRLARAMTLKNAAASLPHGGGKAGILVNAGGVICAAVEHRGGSQAQAFTEIEEKIRLTTQETLERARAGRLLPRQAATEMVGGRIAEAARYRRR